MNVRFQGKYETSTEDRRCNNVVDGWILSYTTRIQMWVGTTTELWLSKEIEVFTHIKNCSSAIMFNTVFLFWIWLSSIRFPWFSSVYSSNCIAKGYRLEGRSSVTGMSKICFFFHSTASRPALGFTQSPIQGAPGVLSPGIKRLGVRLTTHLQKVPKSTMVDLYLLLPIRLHGIVLN
jgi:hypothetical protein